MRLVRSLQILLTAWIVGREAAALPSGSPTHGNHARGASDKLVFAHFMIGIVSDRHSAADFDDDMQRAKAIGIDAFALNIGVDPYTDEQLGYAYQSAANNGMSVFISFDFNWYATSQGSTVGNKIAQYASLPAQLRVGGKAFVSSFAGDGVDVGAIRAAAGTPIFFAPNFHPATNDFTSIDGALNWMAWDNNGNNKAPSGGNAITVSAGDSAYNSKLAGKPYIAPVSPWFSTHYGPEVSYSKNWVFPGDLLWYNRWNDILTLSPQYVEIITWNDYGESHYIGPLHSPHYDDGGSKWVNDMPHDGWLELAVPYIAAFKAGAKQVDSYITKDQLVYWYRQNPRSLNCDATDTCMVPANDASGNYFIGQPNGWQSLADSIFVVSLLKSAGQLTINSGTSSSSFDAPVGAKSYAVDMGLGQQSFVFSRNGAQISDLTGVSLKDVTNVCPCGIYNFNAYVGTLPAGAPDALQPDGLNSLTAGLHVSSCKAQPSLATAPASMSAPNATSGSPTSGTSGGTTGGTTATSTSTSTSTQTSTSIASSTPTTTSKTAQTTSAPRTSTGPSRTKPTTSTKSSGKTSTTSTTTKTTAMTTKATTIAQTTINGCTNTITSSAQIFPTNCLRRGDCWAGPAWQDSPDKCDGQ